jgi:O-antigen ligase
MSLVILILAGLLLFQSKKAPDSSNSPSEVESQIPSKHPKTRRYLEIILAVLIVFAPIYIIGSKNMFFSRLWKYWLERNTNLQGYFTSLGLDARLIYGQAAINTYSTFPLLGVGLGNYAFYFEEMLPYRPIAEVPEILLMTTPETGRDRLITSKNLYLRLLAETGIIGSSTFAAFVIANLGCALSLWFFRSGKYRYWGTASLLGLIAFAFSALTFDSFVIPNTWVVFGLITSTTCVVIHSS